jgi:hypothetical protein
VEEDNKAVGIGSALLVVVIGAGIYFYKFAAPAPPPAAPPPVESASAAAAPGAAAEPLPKLEDSDAFIRTKAASLSSDPEFAGWLKTDDLIPRFAAAVSMIGRGRVPKDGLSFLAPHRKFSVRRNGETITIDPRGYARYDAAADAVGSIDAAAAAALFRKYKPLFQEAYQALGERKGDVADAVESAVRELQKAPIVEGAVRLKEKGLVYAYADDSLERLSPAQKQIMRMGPKNQRKIQDKLSELVRALGL